MKCKTCKTGTPNPGRVTCRRCIERAMARRRKGELSVSQYDRRARNQRRNELRRESKLDREIDRLNRLEWLGLCTMCEREPLDREFACCESCFYEHTSEGRVHIDNYVPIDEWESKATTRIFRALRYRGWVHAEDVGDLLGLNSNRDAWCYAQVTKAPWARKSKQDRPRNALSTQMRRLTSSGMLERRPGVNGRGFEYRLSQSVPREAVQYLVEAA